MLLKPKCPAATAISRAGSPAILCSVLANDREAEDQGYNRGGTDSAVFKLNGNDRTVLGFCCDRYADCAIWREERERIWAEREMLDEAGVQPVRKPVAIPDADLSGLVA